MAVSGNWIFCDSNYLVGPLSLSVFTVPELCPCHTNVLSVTPGEWSLVRTIALFLWHSPVIHIFGWQPPVNFPAPLSLVMPFSTHFILSCHFPPPCPHPHRALVSRFGFPPHSLRHGLWSLQNFFVHFVTLWTVFCGPVRLGWLLHKFLVFPTPPPTFYFFAGTVWNFFFCGGLSEMSFLSGVRLWLLKVTLFECLFCLPMPLGVCNFLF